MLGWGKRKVSRYRVGSKFRLVKKKDKTILTVKRRKLCLSTKPVCLRLQSNGPKFKDEVII